MLRLPFLDLERVEVLRGPQSILFGKNSIAGALNMVTAKPTDDLEGRISGSYSPDGEITEFTGVVSGPLTDTLSGRLVARKYDEDGWMDNSFLNVDELERDELAVRGSLRWDATENLTVDFKAEYNEFETTGRQIEIVQDDPALEDGPIPGANFSQILGILGYPEAITETRQNNERQMDTGDSSDNEVYNYTLNLNYALGDLTLTAISGWVGYEFSDLCDCDFVAAPIFDVPMDEEYDQFSQEIRLVSPGGETVDWIAGVFYQESDLEYADRIRVFEDSVLGLLSGGALQPILGQNAARTYNADSELWAAFGQATWNINDRLRLTLGARYTSEDKEADREINITDESTGDITENPVAPLLFDAVFAIQSEQTSGHSLTGDRSEEVFTPLIKLQWDLSEDVMLYAAWSTGTKSGGFDARANTVGSWEFEDEEATSYEVGAKSLFLDGALELNLAAYLTDYDDLQVSQFDGTLGFTVGNASETRVMGLEADGRWAITDNLIASYALAYLDHEYKDYPNGNCYNRQVPDGDVVNGVQLCDYTGNSGQYTPEWTGTFNLTHTHPLNSNLDVITAFDLSYAGEQNTHVNLDPQWEVDSITQINFRVGLYSESWDIALLAQNLTDEQQFTYVGNTPLSGSTFGTNTFYSFMSRPRTTYLQATYRF